MYNYEPVAFIPLLCELRYGERGAVIPTLGLTYRQGLNVQEDFDSQVARWILHKVLTLNLKRYLLTQPAWLSG